MTPEELDLAFNEAVEHINAHTEPCPPDFLLRLYAYYKKATNNYKRPSGDTSLINAFKTNALFQIHGITESEAKKTYIELVNNYFLYRK